MRREADKMQSARDRFANAGAAEGGQRSSVSVALSLVLLSSGFAMPAAAQTAPPSAVSSDAIKQREQELEAARTEQKNAAEIRQKLQATIAAIGQDRSKLNQQLIDSATQVRSVEFTGFADIYRSNAFCITAREFISGNAFDHAHRLARILPGLYAPLEKANAAIITHA